MSWGSIGERVGLGDKAGTSVRAQAADSSAQCCSQYPGVPVSQCPDMLVC